jgi:hypothetical protein
MHIHLEVLRDYNSVGMNILLYVGDGSNLKLSIYSL